jgi:NAD(P)-dependent dehydrogenase (short-subunit alcohol dehydrogenase family)
MNAGILAGKVAILTGAGAGIGKSTAVAFAKEGAFVTLVDISPENLANTAATVEAAAGRCVTQVCDVGVREQVDRAVAATIEAFGTVDILVNCAFANPAFNTPFVQQTERDLQINLSSSFMGTWNFMQAAYPYLVRRGGKVINFVSAAYTEGQVGMAAYAAAKGAVAGLTNVACLEWGPSGINVNCIAPVIHTEQYDEFLKTAPPGAHEAYVAQNPMRRLGHPDRDAARVAVFLAGPDSDYINGRIISVDGGRGLFRC